MKYVERKILYIIMNYIYVIVSYSYDMFFWFNNDLIGQNDRTRAASDIFLQVSGLNGIGGLVEEQVD